MRGRAWTSSEDRQVRQLAGLLTAAQIAKRIGRTERAVYMRRATLGIVKRNADFGPRFEAFLREKNGIGWSDCEIAAAWNCDRHAVSARRKAMDLPFNRASEHVRERVRQNTKRQLAAAGLPSIGYLRVAAFRARAVKAGWPADLRPRAVQMLNAMWDRGPMTRRELAEACGMPWLGSRKSLHSNDPEGSYLAHLMARGLVVSLGKINRGKGRGRSTCVYSLPLWIERGKVA